MTDLAAVLAERFPTYAQVRAEARRPVPAAIPLVPLGPLIRAVTVEQMAAKADAVNQFNARRVLSAQERASQARALRLQQQRQIIQRARETA